jgi:hypothetical protein
VSDSKPDDDRFLPLIPIGLGLVMVLMGSIFVGIGRYQSNKAEARKSWPTTEATVASCGFSSYRRSGASQEEHSAVTSFKYEVEGRAYELSRTAYVGRGAEALQEPLPYTANQKVQLAYDPLDPQDAVLPSQVSDGPDLAFLLVGGLCGFIALPFLFFGSRWGLRLRRERIARANSFLAR